MKTHKSHSSIKKMQSLVLLFFSYFCFLAVSETNQQLLQQSLKQRLASSAQSNAKLQQTLEKKVCPGPYSAATYGTFANYANQCTCDSLGDTCQFENGNKICNCGAGFVCDWNSFQCAPSFQMFLGKLSCAGMPDAGSFSLSQSQSTINFKPALSPVELAVCTFNVLLVCPFNVLLVHNGYQFELEEVEAVGTANGAQGSITIGVFSSSSSIFNGEGALNSFIQNAGTTSVSSCNARSPVYTVSFSTSDSISAFNLKFKWSTW